ncbi:MAG: hypothetical protein M3O01_03175, partial [Pseudomonadota bacterium]|nr:hypothetical protein [Pseudomonadota bacterium]
MSAFTAEYLARLELWGLLASLVQGVLILGSWRAWQRAAVVASVRHRLACVHFAALGLLPLLTLAIVHATVARMAGQQPHGTSIEALPSALADARTDLALCVAVVWCVGVAVMLLRLAREVLALARV